MPAPKGGRGKRATHPTVMRRIPEGIKEAVEELSELYRSGIWDGKFDSLQQALDVSEEISPTPIVAQYDEYLEAVEEDDDDTDWESPSTRVTPPPEPATPIAQLTKSQEDALSKLQVFIATSTEKFFRLTGYAGSGKSFLVAQFMRWLAANGLNFIAASPTNKASKNLSKLAKSAGVAVNVTTVAKLLGLQPMVDETTGIEDFAIDFSDDKKNLNVYDVILIDEFSMVSKGNFDQLDAGTTNGRSKIVFIGDSAQLPPVNEKEPKVMTVQMKHAALTEVVRYDGAIARVAEEIRSNSLYNTAMYPFVSSEDNTIVCRPRYQWQELALEFFKSPDFSQNPEHCRFIVWRNSTAEKLNAWVRSHLHGEDAPPYVIGDRLIAKKPVFRAMTSFTRRNKKKNEWIIVMNNSEECVVSGTPTLNTDVQGWEFWKVPVTTDEGNKQELLLLTPESEKKRAALMKAHGDRYQWSEKARVDKMYDHVPHSYAITSHKAQGSSINHVFVDTADMRGCQGKDLQKLLYTALTRAKTTAYIPVY